MEMVSLFDPDFWLRAATSAVCAGAIGFERQLRGKPAGVRTSILICLGSATFVSIGTQFGGVEAADPTRIIGQIVVGVGFLGGGVILGGGGSVRGMTSAATVWLLAALGAYIGLGEYNLAVSLTVAVMLVLVGVQKLERSFNFLRRGAHKDDPDT